MKHKVYKITNNINEKIYIGVTKGTLKNRFVQHSKADSIIGRAIRKYGIENFSIDVIHSFETKEESYSKENEIVNDDFLKRKDTYNGKEGGQGGWDHLNNGSTEHIKRTKLGGLKRSNQHIENLKDENFKKEWSLKMSKAHKGKKHSEETKRKISLACLNKTHSEETKKKIGEANSKHQKGKGNSQYGTIWIYSLTEKVSKKIKKEELPIFEKLGWLKGRKQKF